jgi:uncharacterized protein (TIGR03435 family)
MSMRKRKHLFITAYVLAVAIVGTIRLPAQTPSPRFEVASIRAVTGGQGQGTTFLPTGRFVAVNLSLRDLIALAYGRGRPLPNARIIGGPDWIAAQRFNIEAVAEGAVAPDPAYDGLPGAMFLMLRSLLADRFALSVRLETRDTPVYALVRSRPDGALGPRLRPSRNGCSKRGAQPDTLATVTKVSCDMEFTRGRISAQGMSMGLITMTLQRYVDRLLFDETGLTGDFDADLEWTAETLSADQPATGAGASIFTAVQEQLGLRLDSRRAPVEVVIIERAESPTPN